MPIIATAGHVDHGKSTLVLALTGRDPDRWVEEKERGLTIDLGFAWTRLGDKDVGLVDVPGHERFIKNMLAGMGAVDVALFVVASDEGWMPQTEEHLGVLNAVDVSHGVIALTRSDLVDEELQQLAALEVEERVAGTTLEGWPVIPVSATQGHGIDELRAALTAALDAAGEPENIGRPRLWVDRAFTIEGAGLVVTGTLVDGDVAVDERVDLWPGPVTARIRSIQTHEQSSTRASPGSRVALNLTGIERPDIARGAMLGSSTAFRATTRLHAQLRAVRGIEGGLANRGAYHLHAGSGHWPASLQIVGEAAGTTHAIVRLAEPVSLRMGDRFVLREVGRRAVVGGGLVLDPHPGRGHPSDEHAYMLGAALVTRESGALDRERMADALLLRRSFDRAHNIDLDTGGGAPEGAEHLGDIVATKTWIRSELEVLQRTTESFHEQNPMRPGIPKATLASQTGQDVSIVDSLIATAGSGLEETGPVIQTAGYRIERSEAQETAWSDAQTTLRSAGFAVPRSSSLGLDTELFHSLVRDGELIAVGDDVSYLPEQIDDITTQLNGLGDGFTVSTFRDAFEVSRRHAVPLLEWLDKHGYTVRRGDLRVLGPGRAGQD